MNEAEKFAISRLLKDLERALPLTQSFLRHFIDKNILKLDDKNNIVKQNKQYDQVRKFLTYIQKVPGAFLVLVENLKKDRNCRYIACQLVDIKKKRERHLSDQRQKKQERQHMKAQDMLSHQISSRLAMVVNGTKIPGIEVLPFANQVNEHGKLIDKLESMKKDLDYQEGPSEHLSLPQLFERKSRRLEKRANEEVQRAAKAQKEAKEYKTKCEELKQENDRQKVELAKEKENMKLWQNRSREEAKAESDARIQKIKEENTKRHKKEKEQWEEMRCKEKMKTNIELHELKKKYENLKKSCLCRVPKRDFGAQISVGCEDDSQTSDYVYHHPYDHDHDHFSLQGSCNLDQMPIRSDMDTDGLGFSQPQSHSQQDYAVNRPCSKESSSDSSNQSIASDINLQGKGTGEQTLNYFIVKNVNNLNVIQG
ncbi:calponin homology domain-containing protein DDB_G0272472-like [Mizuhopecten yessoensis]|uniref:calponin homology domain-containing protein DDB_G0272472-like n=1 Tax=Mizuhopecten yessoensis TaxID=6573 RepID=UPI000B45BAD0|nr:calponin homology domain-containing protein DDB_G0272472-like [Mizuhopecten yessoensis]